MECKISKISKWQINKKNNWNKSFYPKRRNEKRRGNKNQKFSNFDIESLLKDNK